MRTLGKIVLLSLLFFVSLANVINAANPRANKPVVKPITVNIQAVVDSALIMADDYVTAMSQKPELAQTRLNILKNYYTSLPTNDARDSVRSRIFDYYVNYIETGKAQQADGFKRSFMAIAPDTDEHLGPLYANELILSRERFDTTAVKTNIDLLEAYANRMNYDYDDDITSARHWLHTIRTRPNINDILPGVWVSEDICNYKDEYGGVKYEGSLMETLQILRIRDLNKMFSSIDREINAKQFYIEGLDSLNIQLGRKGAKSGYNLDAVKSHDYMSHCFCIFAAQYGYVPAPILETRASNLNVPLIDDPIYDSDALRTLWSPNYYSRFMQTDNDAYAAYIYWGDERLKVPNPQISAIVRQSVQTSQAMIAGQLSRSQYSFGERLGGNLAAGLVSAGINSLIDAMMVSTDEIWGINLVVQMVNPYKLHAQVFAQIIKTKSNSTKTEETRLLHEFDYYRWEPQDSIFLLGKVFGATDILALHAVSKQQEKEYKQQAKSFVKNITLENKQYCKQRANEIKAMSMGDDRKAAEKELKEYKDNFACWKIWNETALAKLKAKSDKYDQEISNCY